MSTFADTMNWEDVLIEESEENNPRPRAGHCAVGVSIMACKYMFMDYFC